MKNLTAQLAVFAHLVNIRDAPAQPLQRQRARHGHSVLPAQNKVRRDSDHHLATATDTHMDIAKRLRRHVSKVARSIVERIDRATIDTQHEEGHHTTSASHASHEMHSTSAETRWSSGELVVGLITPTGCNTERVMEAIKTAFLAAQYDLNGAAAAARVRLEQYPRWQREMVRSVSEAAASPETLKTLAGAARIIPPR